VATNRSPLRRRRLPRRDAQEATAASDTTDAGPEGRRDCSLPRPTTHVCRAGYASLQQKYEATLTRANASTALMDEMAQTSDSCGVPDGPGQVHDGRGTGQHSTHA